MKRGRAADEAGSSNGAGAGAGDAVASITTSTARAFWSVPPTTADGMSPIDEDTDYPIPLVSLAFPGVQALQFLPSTLLAATDKSVTRRGLVNGRDLVWKTVDFHATPKHSEFSYEDLVDLMENEVRVYLHLRPVWRQLVPEFVFRGSDINFLWVFVTTHEGESLEKLAERGELDEGVCSRALASLCALHQHGVLHGDANLRNAVCRDSDGQVLWVDLEMATLRDDVTPEVFAERAKREMSALGKALGAARRRPALDDPLTPSVAAA